MEFAEACRTFAQKFSEAEPCSSVEDGLLVGSSEKGVEVHWRKDVNGAFEVFSSKIGTSAGPSFLHCAKLSHVTEESLDDLAKSLASACRIIAYGKPEERDNECSS